MKETTFFLIGIAMLGSWLAGIYFFRCWQKTRDRLFYMFGIAFWLMAIERFLLVFSTDPTQEEYYYYYVIRLVAFLIIIYAIVDKNRKSSRG